VVSFVLYVGTERVSGPNYDLIRPSAQGSVLMNHMKTESSLHDAIEGDFHLNWTHHHVHWTNT
jgi:hypothetical protein